MSNEIKPAYTQKQLFGILKILGCVVSTKWETVCSIVDNIKDIEVLEKKWEFWDYKNQNPEYYPLDLSKIETWSTYDNKCIRLDFSINSENKLICDVKIYEGNNFDGQRKELRFSAKLLFPNRFIVEITRFINYKFDCYLIDKYDEYLEQQKNDWLNSFKNQILNEIKNEYYKNRKK